MNNVGNAGSGSSQRYTEEHSQRDRQRHSQAYSESDTIRDIGELSLGESARERYLGRSIARRVYRAVIVIRIVNALKANHRRIHVTTFHTHSSANGIHARRYIDTAAVTIAIWLSLNLTLTISIGITLAGIMRERRDRSRRLGWGEGWCVGRG